ncbi:hypothetical protein, partial [Metabacillus fastidiosus]|uniref:hypothetical protein n=1 Tax=Metabacillus fastidiosus TaxID=1458 RepID=UPI002DB5E7E9
IQQMLNKVEIIRFVCKNCGKVLDLEDKTYQKDYKDHELCLSAIQGMEDFVKMLAVRRLV